MTDDRKIQIVFKTTPSELRVVAGLLERSDCHQVNVNWFHTQLSFVTEPRAIGPRIVNLPGDADGSIPA